MTRLLTFSFCCLLLLSASCRQCRPAVAERVSIATVHDSLRALSLQLDSVMIVDSVTTVIRGDTVLIDRRLTRTRLCLRVDTVERIRYRDRFITQTKVQTVERPVPRWRKVMTAVGVCTAAGAMAAVAVIILRIARRRNR